jgi:hypothetical protein
LSQGALRLREGTGERIRKLFPQGIKPSQRGKAFVLPQEFHSGIINDRINLPAGQVFSVVKSFKNGRCFQLSAYPELISVMIRRISGYPNQHLPRNLFLAGISSYLLYVQNQGSSVPTDLGLI